MCMLKHNAHRTKSMLINVSVWQPLLTWLIVLTTLINAKIYNILNIHWACFSSFYILSILNVSLHFQG